MSTTKLQTFLEKPGAQPPTHNQKICIPVLLSDSKGICLKKQVRTNASVEKQIVWWCEGGASIQKQYRWLQKNLETEVALIGPIHLYIWLGTCNLTTKKGKFISLTSHDSTTVTLISDYIRKINDLVLSSPECKVTALELPEYSIVSYNKNAGHNKPQNFTNEDAQLHQ